MIIWEERLPGGCLSLPVASSSQADSESQYRYLHCEQAFSNCRPSKTALYLTGFRCSSAEYLRSGSLPFCGCWEFRRDFFVTFTFSNILSCALIAIRYGPQPSHLTKTINDQRLRHYIRLGCPRFLALFGSDSYPFDSYQSAASAQGAQTCT